MEGRELNYHKDIKIDPDALDVEWLDQPDLLLDYSLAQDQAGKERDAKKVELEKAERHLKEEKARIALDMKKNPEDYDLPKTSDSTIEDAVTIDPDYKTAKDAYFKALEAFNEAKDNFNRIYSATKSIEGRKASLENLVKLLGQRYFAAPNAERNLKDEHYKRTAQTKKMAREKIKARRTK